MSLKRLTEYLDINHVKYAELHHSPAYTAQQIAEAAHIPGKELAKTVIVKLDSKLAMVVVPSNDKVDLEAVRKASGAHKIELASEHEFKNKFPECETGAMPPFGNLFGMEVYIDKHLAEDKKIAFNAGSHSELMWVLYEDFIKLVHPKILH